MDIELVQNICYSLLSRASHDHIALGTTKLIKLFYLIDCEYFRWHRKTLTGAQWIFYHYGPYCEELLEATHRTPGVEPMPEVEFEEGKFFRGYRVTQYHEDPIEHAHFSIRGAVDAAYKRWGVIDLALILDHVYFETQPMIQAIRFQALDFSLIPDARNSQADELPRSLGNLISEEKKQSLRAKLRGSAAKHVVCGRPIKVEIDEVTAGALESMGERD